MGKNVVWDTECSLEWVSLPRPGSIACECTRSFVEKRRVFWPRKGVFSCLMRMSPSVLSDPEKPRVGWESGCESALRVAWEAIVEHYHWSYQWRLCVTCQMSSVLWPVGDGLWCCTWVFMGVGKVWSKQWVSCELRESSASSNDTDSSLLQIHYDGRALRSNPGLQYPLCMVQWPHLITTGGIPTCMIEGLACKLPLCILEQTICSFTKMFWWFKKIINFWPRKAANFCSQGLRRFPW